MHMFTYRVQYNYMNTQGKSYGRNY
jgi:hypothetical protein